jgi:leader peptidase (prepilin peptidase)/N-methyltransferase
MDLINLQLFYAISFILGSLIGSFINVAVYRMPKMIYFEWFQDCYEFLKLQPKFSKRSELGINLSFPGSYCPNCKNKIPAYYNIPIISYCLLKGQCKFCHDKISPIYPIIELVTAICSGIIAYKFGITWLCGVALLISWVLIFQAAIDIKEYIIPDEVTLPMLWLGIIANNFQLFTTLENSVKGAILGYISFWIINYLFKLIVGKEGMGHGDFKLLAMLGAWLGWKILLPIILISSALGSLVSGVLILIKKCDKNTLIPFGPYLAISGWGALLYKDLVEKWYYIDAINWFNW